MHYGYTKTSIDSLKNKERKMSAKPVTNIQELKERLYADFNQVVAQIESCDNPEIKAKLKVAEGTIAQGIIAAEKPPKKVTTITEGGREVIYKRG
jgi:hypothetical protein